MMERNKLGMILFVVSEATFFFLLIMAYVFYHQPGGEGPAASKMLDPIKTGLFTLALISSSFTMHRAENIRIRQKKSPGTWLMITILLGVIFLIGQGNEYAHLLRSNVTISRNLFGTTFFTLTSFHGLHVFVGLLMLAILFWLAAWGREHEPTPAAMGTIAIYWHFVDAVWLVIFPVVYLWSYFA
jgi:heme/copper-type cytochrome/quinol oxidase subunit 3